MTAQGSLWPYLWEGAQDLSTLVTSDFKRKDKEGLRGASRAGRTAANDAVSKVEISEEVDLRDLPQLRLQERFPNLASVALKGKPKIVVAATFNRFAYQTLSKLSKLTSLDLQYCKALDAVSACAALVQCSQLQELRLPSGAEMSQAALGALAQLTRLTRLAMRFAKRLDAQGLQQLSSLQQLQHLDLEGSKGVTDQALPCLAQLKGLTALSLPSCERLQGSTLEQLSALSGLVKLDLDDCELTTLKGLELLPALQDLQLSVAGLSPVALAPLSALTTLTSLEHDGAAITDECSALLHLPSLARLHVDSISLSGPPAPGVLQQLTYLEVFRSGSLATLLPLPQLEDLQLYNASGDDGTALAAAISKQTSLTQLALEEALPPQQMQQMVAPLRQLQSFTAPLDADEASCLAACTALAELPLLQELTLWGVPQPAHLAMLVRCAQLEVLRVRCSQDVGGASTGLLAALLCKPGMCTLGYPQIEIPSVDKQLLAQMAARVGVRLVDF